MVKQTTRDRDGKETVELRYFVTNATTGMLTPRQLLRLVRLHWSIENDCNLMGYMHVCEDDGAWCTRNKARLVLGVLRMIAYNILEWLHKVHARVQLVRTGSTPRPWRGPFELMHAWLLANGRALLRRLVPRPRPRRSVAACVEVGLPKAA